MATPRQHKRPYSIDIAENLNECVANLAKSVEIVMF
jgi:hypothetical protein